MSVLAQMAAELDSQIGSELNGRLGIVAASMVCSQTGSMTPAG